jgi:hypothetical protein
MDAQVRFSQQNRSSYATFYTGYGWKLMRQLADCLQSRGFHGLKAQAQHSRGINQERSSAVAAVTVSGEV